MITQCTQWCIIADWVTLYKSICSRMHNSMPSDWLLSYIKAVMMFKMSGYFLNRLCILLLIKSLKTTQSKQIPWNNLDNFISKQIFKDIHFFPFRKKLSPENAAKFTLCNLFNYLRNFVFLSFKTKAWMGGLIDIIGLYWTIILISLAFVRALWFYIIFNHIQMLYRDA